MTGHNTLTQTDEKEELFVVSSSKGEKLPGRLWVWGGGGLRAGMGISLPELHMTAAGGRQGRRSQLSQDQRLE
jgi:hypothetical protein